MSQGLKEGSVVTVSERALGGDRKRQRVESADTAESKTEEHKRTHRHRKAQGAVEAAERKRT